MRIDWQAAESSDACCDKAQRERRIPYSIVTPECLNRGYSSVSLPQSGCNLLIFGHIEGERRNLEDALFGTEFVGIKKNLKTRATISEWVRAPTGAFCRGPGGDPFRKLSGVLWVRLAESLESHLFRAYKLYANPYADVCISDRVRKVIEKTAEEWEDLPRSESGGIVEVPRHDRGRK